MSEICETLFQWQLEHINQRSFLGRKKKWKWPTKSELRELVHMEAEEFELELLEAVAENDVRVQNGRVGLTSVGSGSCSGQVMDGEYK